MSESLPCLMRKLAPGKLALAPSLLPFFRSCTLAEQARWGRLGPAGEPRCTEGSQMIVPLPDKDQDSWQARTSLTTTQKSSGRRRMAVAPNPASPRCTAEPKHFLMSASLRTDSSNLLNFDGLSLSASSQFQTIQK